MRILRRHRHLCFHTHYLFKLSNIFFPNNPHPSITKIDKKINKTQLCKAAGITTNAMAKLGRDETVTQETLEKICAVLGCTLDDIVEIKPDNSNI